MLLNIYHRLAGVICLPTCVLTRQTKRGRERLFMGGKKKTMSGHCEKNKNWLNPSLVMVIKSTGSSREPPRKYDRACRSSFLFSLLCFSFFLNLLDCKYATTFHWRTLNAGRFIVPWTKERFSGAIAPGRKKKKRGAQNWLRPRRCRPLLFSTAAPCCSTIHSDFMQYQAAIVCRRDGRRVPNAGGRLQLFSFPLAKQPASYWHSAQCWM